MSARPLRTDPLPDRPPTAAELIPPNRRPRLLITAARLGLPDYRRDRDLPRLLRGTVGGAAGDTVPTLERLEAEAEDLRRAGDGRWSATRHVDLLIALLAERQLHGL